MSGTKVTLFFSSRVAESDPSPEEEEEAVQPDSSAQPGLHPAHRPGAGHAGLRRQEAAEGEEGQEELSQFSLKFRV